MGSARAQPDRPGKWYTLPEVASHFRKSPRTIVRWVQKKKLKAKKIGGKEWLVSEEEIIRFEQEAEERQ